MKVATIKKKIDGNWYCSNCMMGQYSLRNHCFFCGAEFTNFESALAQAKREEFEYENMIYRSEDTDAEE